MLLSCLNRPVPVWYSRQGDHEKAKASMRRLIGNVEGYDIEREYAVLQVEVQASKELTKTYGSSTWTAAFKWPNLKRILIGGIPAMSQVRISDSAARQRLTEIYSQTVFVGCCPEVWILNVSLAAPDLPGIPDVRLAFP